MTTFRPPIERVEIFKAEGIVPITWRVEAYDTDGGVDLNIFSGRDAKERAIDYAGWRYRHLYRGPTSKPRTNEEEPGGFI